jgi:hypothetical protein
MGQNAAMPLRPDARTLAREMVEHAAAFLDALDEAQRARASFAFDEEVERTSWAYFPRDHHGLPLLDMTPKQQKAAHRLLAGGLSLPAYAKTCAIMALESVLNDIEGRRGDRVRDPGRYFLSLFGVPGDAAWGWRFEGHHVCLNFTCAGERIVSATPLFLGANPAEVAHAGTPVLRPCGEEEDAARSLIDMLDASQRASSVISTVAPPDFVLTNMPRVPERARAGELLPREEMVRRNMEPAWRAFEPHADSVAFALERPLGIAASALNERQRAALSALVDVYLDRLPEPMASYERQRAAGNLERLHFAWAGSLARREGHYYRLQGGTFLVEYDNTQDGANHIHAVWRDAASDFGADALRQHLRAEH